MNTPAHLIFGAAIFARPNKPKVNAAAIIGGLFPDFSLYFLVFWSRFVAKNDFSYIFDVQYFSTTWQAVFAIDNSFILWGIVLSVGLWMRRDWIWVLAGSALIHLLFDFLLHHDDARRHFWPLSDWVFVSPLSYWDDDHHGALVGGMEMVAVFCMLLILARRFRRSWISLLFVIIALAEFIPIIMFKAM